MQGRCRPNSLVVWVPGGTPFRVLGWTTGLSHWTVPRPSGKNQSMIELRNCIDAYGVVSCMYSVIPHTGMRMGKTDSESPSLLRSTNGVLLLLVVTVKDRQRLEEEGDAKTDAGRLAMARWLLGAHTAHATAPAALPPLRAPFPNQTFFFTFFHFWLIPSGNRVKGQRGRKRSTLTSAC